MTLQQSRSRRARRRRGPGLARRAAVALLGGALFALGFGLGQASRDNPEPGVTRTSVRTLKPLPLPPARETVTVTVTR